MSLTRISFPQQDWTPGAHPLERKKVGGDPTVALVEFAPAFEDPNWCERCHVIYVVSGELELELQDGRETIRAGEACVLDGDTVHRARNRGNQPVTLFLVSDRQRVPV